MDNSWLTLFLLALAAGFVPMLFAFETYILGDKNGLKRGLGFFSGIVLFRIALFVLLGIFFTSFLSSVSSLFSNISADTKNLLDQVGPDIRSGQHILFDVLLILAGFALWIKAYQQWTRRSQARLATKSNAASRDEGKSAAGLLVLGFTWMAVSVNQWIFMTAAIGEILALSSDSSGRLLATALFMLIANLMLIVPFVFYLIRRQSAQEDLRKINIGMHEAVPYVVVIMLAGIGLYFVTGGITGIMTFMGGQ